MVHWTGRAVRLLLWGCLLLLLPTALQAAELAIGIGADVTSLDPHYHRLSSNVMVAEHIFDSLAYVEDGKPPRPALAESWTSTDGIVWDFHLRPGVVFHDGRPFTAADAAASLRRAMHITDSPLAFSQNVSTVGEITTVDELTLRVRTSQVNPRLPSDLARIAIIPARFADATRTDFDTGAAVIGTGPFRLTRWQPGRVVELAANESYWGGRSQWDTVDLLILPKEGERIAALLAGTVQVIDLVPPADIARLDAEPSITIDRIPSARLLFLVLDHHRDRSPFITGRDGRLLDHNPLRDVRVRRALSRAINRAGLVEQVMEGQAVPALRMTVDGPAAVPEPYDPDGARRLLAEAGWPDGFGLILHAPNDRYLNDAAVARTIGTMLSRIGIVTRVETLPSTSFFSRAANQEFSMALSGYTVSSGDLDVLVTLVASQDQMRGRGLGNRGGYANPALDALLDKASITLDDTARTALIRQAAALATEDQAVIPLFFQVNVWASRAGFRYRPRADGLTLATHVTMESAP